MEAGLVLKRLKMTVQFSVCFYKIVPRLFWSCHETDTDEWRRGEAGLHFFWLYLETPGQNSLLGQDWNFNSDRISSLHFFKNQFCRRRDFLAWSTALKYGDMDWFWFILCPATCRALQSITTVWRKFLASLSKIFFFTTLPFRIIFEPRERASSGTKQYFVVCYFEPTGDFS